MKRIEMPGFVIVLVLLFSITAYCGDMDKKASAVRGVWLTNVDSEVLYSKKNIEEAVNICDNLGFNTIFVVAWNKAMTTYPSKIMKEFTGVEIDTALTGRDPLAELIEAAHSKNIKVIAWFEFGFSSSFEENGGKLLDRKPEWAAKDVNGDLVVKNGFEWMNGFLPEVQDFLLSLVMEVVDNYDIDGIQGDDRLPAMPSESGYDDYTVKLYKSAHNGEEPPAYHKDYEWVKWRAGLLNDFMARIYKTVKAAKPEVIVSMAPSLYPWSMEEYLQDWPTWLANGYVELLIPQVYRYDFEDYRKAMEEIVNEYVPESKRNCFYPGILLNVGDYKAPEEYLEKVIKTNRSFGVFGEVFFFYEGLKNYPEFFGEIYKEKAGFPGLTKK